MGWWWASGQWGVGGSQEGEEGMLHL